MKLINMTSAHNAVSQWKRFTDGQRIGGYPTTKEYILSLPFYATGHLRLNDPI